jgi:hypothetical protein
MKTAIKRQATDQCLLKIADITCALVAADPALRIKIEGATQKFLIQKATPDITIHARWDDLSKILPSGDKIFDSGAVWQLHQQDETYLFSYKSPIFGPIPYKVATVQKDFARGEVLLHRQYFDTDQSTYPLEYPLDELLFVNFLALGRGVEVHSCGIVDASGNGYLFVGQSEAGKTTMARLWSDEPGITILSDDRIILREVDGKIWMFGTPWHGEAGFALPAAAPLTHIYFLQKGVKNELLPQGKAEAAARLFSCCFTPLYFPEVVKFTLAFFEEVVRAVPLHELRFLPDKSVLDLITHP